MISGSTVASAGDSSALVGMGWSVGMETAGAAVCTTAGGGGVKVAADRSTPPVVVQPVRRRIRKRRRVRFFKLGQ